MSVSLSVTSRGNDITERNEMAVEDLDLDLDLDLDALLPWGAPSVPSFHLDGLGWSAVHGLTDRDPSNLTVESYRDANVPITMSVTSVPSRFGCQNLLRPTQLITLADFPQLEWNLARAFEHGTLLWASLFERSLGLQMYPTPVLHTL